MWTDGIGARLSALKGSLDLQSNGSARLSAEFLPVKTSTKHTAMIVIPQMAALHATLYIENRTPRLPRRPSMSKVVAKVVAADVRSRSVATDARSQTVQLPSFELW